MFWSRGHHQGQGRLGHPHRRRPGDLFLYAGINGAESPETHGQTAISQREVHHLPGYPPIGSGRTRNRPVCRPPHGWDPRDPRHEAAGFQARCVTTDWPTGRAAGTADAPAANGTAAFWGCSRRPERTERSRRKGLPANGSCPGWRHRSGTDQYL